MEYIASHSDLISVFGTDIDSARTHYFASGVTEGRTFDGYDEMSYLASHADLLSSYGSNTKKL
jgi:hypothetical protein